MDVESLLTELANDREIEIALDILEGRAEKLHIPSPVLHKKLDDISKSFCKTKMTGGRTLFTFDPTFYNKYEHRVKILHISDLHYRISSRNITANQLDVEKDPKGVLLKDGLSQIGKVNCIVVSGDLATIGDDYELDEASTYISNLGSIFLKDDSKGNIILVQGNHDADWKTAREYYKTSKHKFRSFDSSLREQGDWIWPYSPRGWGTPYKTIDGILVWTFNSSIASGLVRYDKIAEIDKILKEAKNADNLQNDEYERFAEFFQEDIPAFTNADVDRMAILINTIRDNSTLRVAVCHHNVAPVRSERWRGPQILQGTSVVPVDSGYFLHKVCENGFRVILHGHTHRGAISDIGYSNERVLCIGAPRLSRSLELEYGDDEIGFNLIEFLEYQTRGTWKIVIQKYTIEGDTIVSLNAPIILEKQQVVKTPITAF